MKLEEQMRENPWNWKDTIAAFTVALTVGTVVWQGGRLMERLDQTNLALKELSQQLHSLRKETADSQRDITELRGSDRLHEEQIRVLQLMVEPRQRSQ